MNIASDDSSGTLVLRVSGDMRLWGRGDGVECLAEVLRAQANSPQRMILNLAEVEQLDSLGVGALVRVLVECRKRETDLEVVLPIGFPGQVLKVVHIFDASHAFANETAAVRAFLKAAAG